MDDAPPQDAASPFSEEGEDLALMKRVGVGDMEAFEKLVEKHQGRVVGTVARMLGNDAESEDIAQQVFIRVWNSAARYEPSAKFTTWLYTIVRNLVFNEVRRRGRRPVSSLSELTVEMTSPEASPASHLLETEMEEAIQKAIEALPEMQRMALVLRRYQEVSYEEMADILEVSVPAVKSLLFRARGELRESLKRYLEGN